MKFTIDANTVAITNENIFLPVSSKTNPLVVTFTNKFMKKTIENRNDADHLFRLWLIKTQFLFTKNANTVEQEIDIALLGVIGMI